MSFGAGFGGCPECSCMRHARPGTPPAFGRRRARTFAPPSGLQVPLERDARRLAAFPPTRLSFVAWLCSTIRNGGRHRESTERGRRRYAIFGVPATVDAGGRTRRWRSTPRYRTRGTCVPGSLRALRTGGPTGDPRRPPRLPPRGVCAGPGDSEPLHPRVAVVRAVCTVSCGDASQTWFVVPICYGRYDPQSL